MSLATSFFSLVSRNGLVVIGLLIVVEYPQASGIFNLIIGPNKLTPPLILC